MRLPELQSLLDAAAESVPDADRSHLPDVLREGHRRRRVRWAAAAVIAVIAVGTGSIVAVAQQNSNDGTAIVGPPSTSAVPTTVAPTTSGPTGTTGATGERCTEADMRKPVGPMPAARAVTEQFFLEKHRAWLDPVDGVTPAVDAEAAWEKLSSVIAGGGKAQLLLGYYTSIFPSKNGVPENVHRLAWAVYADGVAVSPVGAPIGPDQDTTPTAPPAPCHFGVTYTVLDATTGQSLVIASHG